MAGRKWADVVIECDGKIAGTPHPRRFIERAKFRDAQDRWTPASIELVQIDTADGRFDFSGTSDHAVWPLVCQTCGTPRPVRDDRVQQALFTLSHQGTRSVLLPELEAAVREWGDTPSANRAVVVDPEC